MVGFVYSKRVLRFDIKKFTHIFFWWFSCREIVFEMCSADTVIASMVAHDSKMS